MRCLEKGLQLPGSLFLRRDIRFSEKNESLINELELSKEIHREYTQEHSKIGFWQREI